MAVNRSVVIAHCFLVFNQFSAIFLYSTGKVLMQDLPFFVFVAARLTVAVPFMITAAFAMKQAKLPSKKGWIYLLASSFIGIAVGQCLLFAGIQRSSAANASIINAPCVPIFTALFSVLRGTDKMTIPKAVGFVFAIMGALVLLEVEHFEMAGKTVGNLLILACTVTSAANCLVQKKALTSYLTPLQFSAYSSVCGYLMFVALWSPFGMLDASNWAPVKDVWFIILFTGVFCTAVTWTLGSYALKETSPMTVTVYNILQPPLSAVFTTLFLDEVFTLREGLGSLAILLGLFMINGETTARLVGHKILVMAGVRKQDFVVLSQEDDEEDSFVMLEKEQPEAYEEKIAYVKMETFRETQIEIDGASESQVELDGASEVRVLAGKADVIKGEFSGEFPVSDFSAKFDVDSMKERLIGGPA